jgi:hypothetical protein
MAGQLKMIMLLVAIAAAVVLGGSAYGMGKESGDMKSTAYKSGAAFTGVSAVVLALAIVLLGLGR